MKEMGRCTCLSELNVGFWGYQEFVFLSQPPLSSKSDALDAGNVFFSSLLLAVCGWGAGGTNQATEYRTGYTVDVQVRLFPRSLRIGKIGEGRGGMRGRWEMCMPLSGLCERHPEVVCECQGFGEYVYLLQIPMSIDMHMFSSVISVIWGIGEYRRQLWLFQFPVCGMKDVVHEQLSYRVWAGIEGYHSVSSLFYERCGGSK